MKFVFPGDVHALAKDTLLHYMETGIRPSASNSLQQQAAVETTK